ncbi:hypothetical protein [Streptomyces sp. NPDC007083]|uniref:hypothetical protein n=1 Tax=unclassified Streptomyces TaxID=2593676 RepID=UPI0033C32C12
MREQGMQAHRESRQIATTLHDPRGSADHLGNVIDGHNDGYLDEVPGAACQAAR